MNMNAEPADTGSNGSKTSVMRRSLIVPNVTAMLNVYLAAAVDLL
jgi:hypothetical protein